MTDVNIVILGQDHYNTYGIVRSLGEFGVKTTAIILGCKKDESFVLKSKYLTAGYAYDNSTSVVQCLQKIATQNNILICCSDAAEEIVIENYDSLKAQYILPVCEDISELKRLMCKTEITKLAAECNLIVPKTWNITNRTIPIGIEYPCITKPETSTEGLKSDIVICSKAKDLEDVVVNHSHCRNFAVQQYIDFEKEISILGAVLKNGDVVFSGCIDKLRTCMIGTSSYAMMVDNSIIGDAKSGLECLLKKSGYKGLFSAEFLLKQGQLYFLEVNFRNDGNAYVATASGINLPYLWVNSYYPLGREYTYKPSYPCYFMLEIEDFLARRRNKVSLTKWYSNLRKTDTCLVYNNRDLRPFTKKLVNIARTIIKSKITR